MRIGDVNCVLGVDENAAGPAKLLSTLPEIFGPDRKSVCDCCCDRRRRAVPWNRWRRRGECRTRRTKGTASVGVGKVLPTQAALESPGPVPFFPHALMNVPSFENFTMRAFESPPCPSATNMSPFEATARDRGVPKRGAHCTLSSQDLALGGLGLPPLAPPKIGGGISPYRMGARNRYRFSPWIKATAVPLKMRVPFLIQKGWSEAGVRSTAVGAIQRSL